MAAPALSVVMPVLNEADGVVAALSALAPYRARGVEVIVADGGSVDETARLAAPMCDAVIVAPRGRGSQMNAGAAKAGGDVLLFLHADTRLPDGFDMLLLEALARTSRVWGRFDVRIQSSRIILRVVAAMMNIRSRLTGVATGDQAIFSRRAAFESVGGFEDIPLMEDIAFSRWIKRQSAPLCLSAQVTTSGRRWEKHGVVKTILTMWALRLRFFFGADPRALARAYGYRPRDE